jgi:hypothetical protein
MNPAIWVGATLELMPMKTSMLGCGFALTEAGNS